MCDSRLFRLRTASFMLAYVLLNTHKLKLPVILTIPDEEEFEHLTLHCYPLPLRLGWKHGIAWNCLAHLFSIGLLVWSADEIDDTLFWDTFIDISAIRTGADAVVFCPELVGTNQAGINSSTSEVGIIYFFPRARACASILVNSSTNSVASRRQSEGMQPISRARSRTSLALFLLTHVLSCWLTKGVYYIHIPKHRHQAPYKPTTRTRQAPGPRSRATHRPHGCCGKWKCFWLLEMEAYT